MKDARATLISGLSANTALVKQPLTDDEMRVWRAYIEEIARDFVAGRAAVDPRDYPKTCERCSLQALCRIQDNPPQTDDENGDTEEAADA